MYDEYDKMFGLQNLYDKNMFITKSLAKNGDRLFLKTMLTYTYI